MRKIFYITKPKVLSGENTSVPDMDRFARIEKLNDLISLGWSIQEFCNGNDGEYFVLEK